MRPKKFKFPWTFFLSLVLTVNFVAQALASPAAEVAKKPITYDVYDKWKSIQGTRLSRDGSWLVYSLVPQEGDAELVILNLKTKEEKRLPRGLNPQITVDNNFVVFTIAPPKEEVDKAKKEKKKPEEMPKNGLGIVNLRTGEVQSFDRVKSFKLPEESGAYVAYLLEPPLKKEPEAKKEPEKKEEKAEAEKKEEKKEEKKKEPGTDLVVRELASGKNKVFQEVIEYNWNKKGTRLAYAVSSPKPENDGVYVYEPEAGKSLDLMTGLGHYKQLAFDEDGQLLAFLSDRDEYKLEAPSFKLYYWTPKQPSAQEVASKSSPGMPPGMAPSEHGLPLFSRDGGMLFFGYAPLPKAEPKDSPEPIKVDIWHWKDLELQPMQKVRAEDEKKRNYLAVYHLKEKKLVPLASPDMPEVRLSEDKKVALGVSDIPYKQLISWDQAYYDYYLVDLKTGGRQLVLRQQPGQLNISPGGNYLIYYDYADKSYYAYKISDRKAYNLTAKLGVSFEQEEWDTPQEPRPYGLAGWTPHDECVLIYDRFDIWEIKPDGSAARMITGGLGRKEKIVFRYVSLDPEEKTIPVTKPILLSAFDEKTKGTGYYRVTIQASTEPQSLVMLDKLFRDLRKAKEAEVYVFTLQRFEEFPDLWVSGSDFTDMRKVSQANPQQAEYNWGRAELIHYRNADGKELEAILIKPEDFDPNKKYPLMVYIYERLSGQLHRYYPPSPGTSINFSRYVSNGYVILQPDIVYEVGNPGLSALKCVIPAVEKVVSLGFIDPKRIGIQGHSWGGYQITYLITRTNIFAAVEAGAAVGNMISAYGGIRWGSGMSRAFQYEKTQSRIGAPPWERALQFIENSPIFWVERVNTPYLTIHNDEDDAVPWYQGIEFFTALRRLGKEAYMFNFNGEKHGLRQRENQKYWTVHLDEFFDHYLKGAPRPEWMEKGVPYLERGKRDISSLFEPKEGKKEEKKN